MNSNTCRATSSLWQVLHDSYGGTGLDRFPYTHDIDGSGGQQALVTFERPLFLAISERHRCLGAEARITFRVPRSERLLDPANPMLLHCLNSPCGRADIPFKVDSAVDHQPLLRANCLSDLLDKLDIAIVLITQTRIASLSKRGPQSLKTRSEPLGGFLSHVCNLLVMRATGASSWRIERRNGSRDSVPRGAPGPSAAALPDLHYSYAITARSQIAADDIMSSGGMVGFKDYSSPAEIEAIRAFVTNRAQAEAQAQKAQ